MSGDKSFANGGGASNSQGPMISLHFRRMGGWELSEARKTSASCWDFMD